MAKQTINLGTGELTGDGESIRSAFDKINKNFNEVYTDLDDIIIPDVSNFITAADIPFIPTDISDLSDTQVLLGSGPVQPYLRLTNTPFIIRPALLVSPIEFTRTVEGFETDVIDVGLTLARAGNQGLYNIESELEYDRNTHNSPIGTEWNSDGWGDLLNLPGRTYDNLRSVLNNAIGENIVGAELVMHDTINDKYYKFSFTDWGNNNGGSFAYTRTLVQDPNYFVKADYATVNDVDVIEDDSTLQIGITRSNNNGIYNPFIEEGWNSAVSPAGTLWNISGWNDLSNLTDRSYTNLYAAFGNGGLGNKIVGTECVIYVPSIEKYYAVKFLSWTQNNVGGGFSYVRYEIDQTKINAGITFPDGTVQKSAYIETNVVSTAPGERRIETASGYKAVSVTVVTPGVTQNAVIRQDSNNWDFYVNATPELNQLYDTQNTFNYLEFSFDGGNTWIKVRFGGGQYDVYYQMVFDDDINRPVVADAVVTYRTVTGGDPVVWWNKSELPGGATDFRGAVIDYHAYTGDSTIIGTIHIVDDDAEENITHTEVASGSTDGENDDLWLVQNEGTISYRRIDGDSSTLKIQWTARVFYGSELYD